MSVESEEASVRRRLKQVVDGTRQMSIDKRVDLCLSTSVLTAKEDKCGHVIRCVVPQWKNNV